VPADAARCAAVTGAALATKAACQAVITAAADAVSGTTKACTYTYAASAGTLAGATGTANKANFIMQQVSEDPASYDLATIPKIYGWMAEKGDSGTGSPSFFRLKWTLAGETLQAEDITVVPAKYRIAMKPELVSFGRNYVAIVSPIDCAATNPVGSLAGQRQTASAPYRWSRPDTRRDVANPSIRYFKLGTRP